MFLDLDCHPYADPRVTEVELLIGDLQDAHCPSCGHRGVHLDDEDRNIHEETERMKGFSISLVCITYQVECWNCGYQGPLVVRHEQDG